MDVYGEASSTRTYSSGDSMYQTSTHSFNSFKIIHIKVEDISFSTNNKTFLNQVKSALRATTDVKLYGNLTTWNSAGSSNILRQANPGKFLAWKIVTPCKFRSRKKSNLLWVKKKNRNCHQPNIINTYQWSVWSVFLKHLRDLIWHFRYPFCLVVYMKNCPRHIALAKFILRRYISGTLIYDLCFPRSDAMNTNNWCAPVDSGCVGYNATEDQKQFPQSQWTGHQSIGIQRNKLLFIFHLARVIMFLYQHERHQLRGWRILILTCSKNTPVNKCVCH